MQVNPYKAFIVLVGIKLMIRETADYYNIRGALA